MPTVGLNFKRTSNGPEVTVSVVSDDLKHVTEFPFPQTTVRHSPTGFEWGYGGSGPADLALNIMLATCRDDSDWLYNDFKNEVIAKIPFEGRYINIADVHRWIDEKREAQ